ncbi:Electron transport complex protein RnfD [hydrothermal vent metagenome]|uniref:Electron transport complex protein RnfD n=1 Tax=hydrothermal vent metagenome TaxID=652676 RepID=A0A3B1BFH0_9ZZZZ
MAQQDPKLIIQPGPQLRQEMTTPAVMRDVWYALTPATLAGVWFFGFGALLVLLVSIAGAVLTEWFFSPPEKRRYFIGDGSAILTGWLLGLTLPPALPLWMAFLGGVVAIGVGKTIWGGMGGNLFNPALVGRAFLLATFPIAMTTWTAPGDFWTIPSSTFAIPLMHGVVDTVTQASPLGVMKFEYIDTGFFDLLFGTTSGSLGETSGLLLILGGIFLWWRRDLDWRIPVGILGTAMFFSLLLYMSDADKYPGPIFTALSGGMLLGAIFMATDPVTSPLTSKGIWIFAIGIGFLVVLIRVFGGFPEGIMYAILLMNAATPLIDRYTQPRVFGRGLDTK